MAMDCRQKARKFREYWLLANDSEMGGYQKFWITLAAENGCKSIAFPCISTGNYGCPIEDAAKIAVEDVRMFLLPTETQRLGEDVMEVSFCCFSVRDASVYGQLLKGKINETGIALCA